MHKLYIIDQVAAAKSIFVKLFLIIDMNFFGPNHKLLISTVSAYQDIYFHTIFVKYQF